MKAAQLTKQQAAAILLERKAARESLEVFASRVPVPGSPSEEAPEDSRIPLIETEQAEHHKLILRAMQKCMETKHGRLMIAAPPGSAKSTYASVVAPTWYLGRQANRRIILGSYGDTLAKKMGRRTRQLLREPETIGILQAEVSKDSHAINEFSLTNGSEYIACGLLTGVTGNRAHGIIIDDPVKGRKEADSEVMQKSTLEAYEDDLLTRLIPGGWVVIIQTRWNENDLSGQILPEGWKGESGEIVCRDGNTWTVLCLQARCETLTDPLGRKWGEYLWPDWFDAKHWAQFESNSRTWGALYQQLPCAKEGNFFKPDMIQTTLAEPAGILSRVSGWDLAATKGGGDWTVKVKLGKLQDGRTIILDVVRLQEGPEGVRTAVKNNADRDGRLTKIRMAQDPGQAGKSQALEFGKLLVGFSVTILPVTGSKEIRAGGFAAQVNVGNVVMLKAPWNQKFIEELRVFPNGATDDQVDAASDAFNLLYEKTVLNISREAVNRSAQRRSNIRRLPMRKAA